jgi:hypothetical protein
LDANWSSVYLPTIWLNDFPSRLPSWTAGLALTGRSPTWPGWRREYSTRTSPGRAGNQGQKLRWNPWAGTQIKQNPGKIGK